jgi:signal transduction histidine kinase
VGRFDRAIRFALPAALVVLLVVLADVQYRWVAELSENERRRMESTLEATLAVMARQLEQEVSSAVAAVQIDPAALQEGEASGAAAAWRRWSATAAAPELIARVDVVRRSDDGFEAFMLGRHDGALHPQPWESLAAPLRREIERDASAGSLEQRRWVIDEPLAVAARIVEVPLITASGPLDVAGVMAQIQRARRPRLSGWVVVHLEPTVLRERLMPELVARFVPSGDYRIVLLRRSDGQLLYASGEGAVDRPDATSPLLTDTVGPLVIPATRSDDGTLSTLSPEQALHDQLRIGSATEARHQWELRALHRAGSVDAAVARLQRRNLLVGGSILTILALGIATASFHARRADALARQQMEFVSVMSHELRTPIAIVQAAAENLSRGVVTTPERGREYGAAIAREARRLGGMVEQVLEFARRPEHAAYHFEEVDLRELVRDITESMHGVADEAGGRIERVDTPAPVTVAGDAEALSRAVRNLVINAIRHSGERPEITVATSAERRDATIRVSDRGAGIPPEERERLTEPFYRGRRAVERQIPGSGLGLAIVRRIVEAHGGRLLIENAAEGGASFTICLPRVTVR